MIETKKKPFAKLTDIDKRHVYRAIQARIEQLEGYIAEYDAIPNGTMVSNLLHLAVRLNREELAHQKLLLVRFIL